MADNNFKPSTLKRKRYREFFNEFYARETILKNLVDKIKNHNNLEILDSNDYFQYKLIYYFKDIQRGIYQHQISRDFKICGCQVTKTRSFNNKFKYFEHDQPLIVITSPPKNYLSETLIEKINKL